MFGNESILSILLTTKNKKIDDIKLINSIKGSQLDHFIKNLPLCYDTDHIFFVHAGIDLNVPLDKQTEDDMLWIRKNWLDNPKLASKLILHGHTIVEQVTHYGNRINIDTGAAWGDNLSAVVTINDNVWLLTNQGRTEITPHNKQ